VEETRENTSEVIPAMTRANAEEKMIDSKKDEFFGRESNDSETELGQLLSLIDRTHAENYDTFCFLMRDDNEDEGEHEIKREVSRIWSDEVTEEEEEEEGVRSEQVFSDDSQQAISTTRFTNSFTSILKPFVCCTTVIELDDGTLLGYCNTEATKDQKKKSVVRRWHRDGRLVGSVETASPVKAICDVDSQRFMTGLADGSIRLWNKKDHQAHEVKNLYGYVCCCKKLENYAEWMKKKRSEGRWRRYQMKRRRLHMLRRERETLRQSREGKRSRMRSSVSSSEEGSDSSSSSGTSSGGGYNSEESCSSYASTSEEEEEEEASSKEDDKETEEERLKVEESTWVATINSPKDVRGITVFRIGRQNIDYEVIRHLHPDAQMLDETEDGRLVSACRKQVQVFGLGNGDPSILKPYISFFIDENTRMVALLKGSRLVTVSSGASDNINQGTLARFVRDSSNSGSSSTNPVDECNRRSEHNITGYNYHKSKPARFKVWNINTGECIQSWDCSPDKAEAIASLSDGSFAVVMSSANNDTFRVQIWSMKKRLLDSWEPAAFDPYGRSRLMELRDGYLALLTSDEDYLELYARRIMYR